MSKRLGRKRLSVDIPKNLHDSLMLLTQHRNITLTKYVIRALIRYSLHETQYENNINLFKEFIE